jgi:hypothetical protein
VRKSLREAIWWRPVFASSRGRDGQIRTDDPLLPNSLRPVRRVACLDQFRPGFERSGCCQVRSSAVVSECRGTFVARIWDGPGPTGALYLARPVGSRTPRPRPTRRRHLASLAYGSLHETPPHQPSSGLVFARRNWPSFRPALTRASSRPPRHQFAAVSISLWVMRPRGVPRCCERRRSTAPAAGPVNRLFSEGL